MMPYIYDDAKATSLLSRMMNCQKQPTRYPCSMHDEIIDDTPFRLNLVVIKGLSDCYHAITHLDVICRHDYHVTCT